MASITDEELRDEFGTFNLTFASDAVLFEMKLLCLTLQLTVAEIFEEFFAYIQTTSAGKSKNHAVIVTADLINHFKKIRTIKPLQPSTPLSKTPMIPMTKGQPFLTPTPGSINRPTKQFSNSAASGRFGGGLDGTAISGRLDFGDDSDEPVSARKSDKRPPVAVIPFADRINKGEIVASLGDLLEGLTWTELPRTPQPLKVTAKDSSTCLSDRSKYPFMFVKYQDVALSLNCSLDELGGEIAMASSITEYSSPAIIGEKTATLGRVLPLVDGRLNARDLWIQTSSTLHNGIIHRLDLDLTQRFSLFPGQIISCIGHGNGDTFAVEKILHGAAPPAVNITLPYTDTLHLFVACGPFSLTAERHDQVPAPLQCLIQCIQESKPELVILLGPFIDPKLLEDDAFLSDYTFADHFKTMMEFIFQEIIQKLGCHVVLVPSTGQLVGMPVYPVAPYTLEDCVKNSLLYSDSTYDGRIIFVPEPSLIVVNGVVIGLTSTDIISHLCQKEINFGVKEERISRMAGHLIQQQSFYPLYPADVPADITALNKYAKMRFRPHILITPSDMKGFAKLIEGTVCVNPERLAKQYSGGSYARIFITADENSENEKKLATSLDGRIAVEIVRI